MDESSFKLIFSCCGGLGDAEGAALIFAVNKPFSIKVNPTITESIPQGLKSQGISTWTSTNDSNNTHFLLFLWSFLLCLNEKNILIDTKLIGFTIIAPSEALREGVIYYHQLILYCTLFQSLPKIFLKEFNTNILFVIWL